MLFIVAILFCACALSVAWFFWQRLDAATGGCQRRWLLVWAVKGLFTPLLVWLALNSGLLPGLPPLLPEIDAAQSSGGKWLPVFFDAVAPGWIVIASHWLGLTFGWLVADLAPQQANRRDLIVYALVWGAVMLPIGALILYFCQWWGLGAAAALWLAPVAHGLLSRLDVPKPIPLYSRAIARMKMGKYGEAEWEIIRELEKCEDDFQGWMLLAELYATAFHDIPAAEQTIRDLCAQPNVTPSDVSVALQRLADWHLKAENPDGARRALEAICARLPGTHMAHMARLRLGQIPDSREEYLAQREVKKLRLPALSDHLESAAASGPRLTTEEAVAQARQCVKKLQQDPDQAETREQFARLLAEQLGKTEAALQQLELLLAMPNQPDRQRAEWLGLVAAWQMKYRQDPQAARVVLERLIRQYPDSPQAFAAQQRLNLMAVEERIRKTRAAAPAETSRRRLRPGTDDQ